MRRTFVVLVCASLAFASVAVAPQATTHHANAVQELDSAEAEMFRIFSAGNAAGFERITGEDYLTINADGAMLDRAAAKALMEKFKGAQAELSDTRTRVYGDVGVLTGQARFTLHGLKVAQIYFTQVWLWRDNRWQFINWQGTMTGSPAWYPVILTVVGMLALFALYTIIRTFLRRRTSRTS